MEKEIAIDRIDRAVALVTEAAESLGWKVGMLREGGVTSFEFEELGHPEIGAEVWESMPGSDIAALLGNIRDRAESYDIDYQTRLAVGGTEEWVPVREILADKENEKRILWDFYWGMEKKLGEVAL